MQFSDWLASLSALLDVGKYQKWNLFSSVVNCMMKLWDTYKPQTNKQIKAVTSNAHFWLLVRPSEMFLGLEIQYWEVRAAFLSIGHDFIVWESFSKNYLEVLTLNFCAKHTDGPCNSPPTLTYIIGLEYRLT